MQKLGCLLLGLCLVSCEEKHAYISDKKTVVNMSSSIEDVGLPTSLWEELQAVYEPLALDKSTSEEQGSKAKLEIPTAFFGFKVYLVEKTRGVIKGGNQEFVFGQGGGVLRLEDYLNEKRGTFYLGLVPDLEMGDKDILHVYYLSNTKTVEIDGKIHGAGCDRYLDITDYFAKSMKKDGFILNTSGGRHISLLAGSYFMAASVKGKLYLSQLTISDSRYKPRHCNWK